MPRNDASLITGLSSAASRRISAKQHGERLVKLQKGQELRPHAEQIKAEVAKMRLELKEKLHTIKSDMSADEIKAIVLGVEFAEESIVKLQDRIIRNVKLSEES